MNIILLIFRVACVNRGGSTQKLNDIHKHVANNNNNALCNLKANSDSSDFDQGLNSAGFTQGSQSLNSAGFTQGSQSLNSAGFTQGSKFGQNNVGFGKRINSAGLGLGENAAEFNEGEGHEGIKKSAYIAEIKARSKMEAKMNHQAAKSEKFAKEQGDMISGHDQRESANTHEALSWQNHQEWKDIQRFQNAGNFDNFRHFQNYREPHELNEIKHTEYPSFSKGLELKFTNMSTTASIENYLKIFIIESKEDTTAYVNLVSTTQHYHPQFRIYERRGSEYILMQNINFNNKFFFSHHGFYIIEIGTDSNIDTDPYQNIKYGGFVVYISSVIRTIEEILNDDQIKVSMHGYEGYVSFTQNTDLSLFQGSSKYISHGICNYQITPLYDSSSKTISVYFHRGSSQMIGQIMRASRVEVKCNRTVSYPKMFYGKEIKQAMYHFDVESKRICDLITVLE
jgi:hypothetical protein